MQQTLIPLMALLIPIVIVPTSLAFKHARFLREVEHKERMRAMELGRNLAEDEWSPIHFALSIGVGVPIGSMLVAWWAGAPSVGASGAIWTAATVLGLGGLICGTVLASRHFAARQQVADRHGAEDKPAFDPDAFDVVGSRG